MSQNNIYSLFLPNKGCQNKCIYCNQFFATGFSDDNTAFFSQLQSLKNNIISITEIAIYGSNFTALNIDNQKFYLDAVNNISDFKIPIRISTRPDYLNKEILDFLYKNNVRTIEIGLQSASDDILKLLNRNYSISQVVALNNLLKSYNFSVSYHLMLGLPTETFDDFKHSVHFVCSLKPDFVRIHPTLVISDTVLHFMYINNLFTPLSFDEAVSWSVYAYKRFLSNNIKVIRLGLHSDISLLKHIVAGPYHPSFAQFVKSSIILDKIKKIMNNSYNSFILETDNKINDIIRGYKNRNIPFLKNAGMERIVLNNNRNGFRLKLLKTNKVYDLTGIVA